MEKQIKFKLSQIIENEQEEGENMTYMFKPVAESMEKLISLKFSGKAEDVNDLIDALGMPKAIKDSIFIELGAKEQQTKLEKKD